MRILYLGPMSHLVEWLTNYGDDVHVLDGLQNGDPAWYYTHERIQDGYYDCLLSYNYRHKVSQSMIDKFRMAINLHISYLPWNRGADPNFWSIVDDTPKGVSIHRMNERFDEGDIIAQCKVQHFYRHQTLENTYTDLHYAIGRLFKSIWPNIEELYKKAVPQKGQGSYHRTKDKKELFDKICPQGWQTKIGDMLALLQRN